MISHLLIFIFYLFTNNNYNNNDFYSSVYRDYADLFFFWSNLLENSYLDGCWKPTYIYIPIWLCGDRF